MIFNTYCTLLAFLLYDRDFERVCILDSGIIIQSSFCFWHGSTCVDDEVPPPPPQGRFFSTPILLYSQREGCQTHRYHTYVQQYSSSTYCRFDESSRQGVPAPPHIQHLKNSWRRKAGGSYSSSSCLQQYSRQQFLYSRAQLYLLRMYCCIQVRTTVLCNQDLRVLCKTLLINTTII